METKPDYSSKNSGSFERTEEKNQIVALAGGIVVAYAITCIVFIIYAVLLKYSAVSEGNIRLVVTITSLISVIVAGFDAAKGAKKSGWLWGVIAGAIYAVILICIGIFINGDFTLDTSSVVLIVLSIAGGGLGGVIGINFSR